MKRQRIRHEHPRPTCIEDRVGIPPILLLLLCPILAVSLLQACTLGPVVMVASTTAAGLVMEAEKAVTEGDKADVVAVEQEVVVYEGPGRQYSEIARLNKGVEVKVLRKDGDWVQCKSGRFEDGWIPISAVKDI